MRRRLVSSSAPSAAAASTTTKTAAAAAAGSTSSKGGHSHSSGGGGKGGRVRVTTSTDASAHLDLISSLVLGGGSGDAVDGVSLPAAAAAAAAAVPAAQQARGLVVKGGKENRTPTSNSSCGRARCSGATPPAAAASASKPTTTHARPSPSPSPLAQEPQSAAQFKAALRVAARETEARIVVGVGGKGDEEARALRRSVRRLGLLAEQAVASCGRMEAQLLTAAATVEASEAQALEAKEEIVALRAELEREKEGREGAEARLKGVLEGYWRERAVVGRVMEAVATLALSEAQHDGPEEGGAALEAILALQGQAAACLRGNPLVGVEEGDGQGAVVAVKEQGQEEEEEDEEMY